MYAFRNAEVVKAELGDFAVKVWQDAVEMAVSQTNATAWRALIEFERRKAAIQHEFRSQMSHGKRPEKTDRNTKVRERRIPLAKKREAKQLQAQVEQPERLKEAELLWQLVLSWGEKCATVRIFNELSEYRQKEFRALRTTKFAQYDHHGLAAHRRAYLAWAEW